MLKFIIVAALLIMIVISIMGMYAYNKREYYKKDINYAELAPEKQKIADDVFDYVGAISLIMFVAGACTLISACIFL